MWSSLGVWETALQDQDGSHIIHALPVCITLQEEEVMERAMEPFPHGVRARVMELLMIMGSTSAVKSMVRSSAEICGWIRLARVRTACGNRWQLQRVEGDPLSASL